ncbi:competence protein CoiA [Virgibacillus xinjiangensis]
MYHEWGKLQLYRWLQAQRLQVELEAYLPEIHQRPDLLLTLPGRRIAIEYQCAKIPISQLNERNRGYIDEGIIPLWILGEKRMNRRTTDHFKLDRFSIHLAHQFSPDFPLTLFYFCPHTLQFLTFQDIHLTSAGMAIGKFRQQRLNNLHFPDIFRTVAYSPQDLFSQWKKEKQRFRMKPKNRLYGKELAWHQWLYLNGRQVERLPSLVYLPVPSQYMMTSPPWDWQSRLLIDLLTPLPLGQKISLHRSEQLLRKSINSPKYYPLIKEPGNPVREYFKLLVDCGYLHPIGHKLFQKVRDVEYHQHIEQSTAADDELMDYLADKSKGKIKA